MTDGDDLEAAAAPFASMPRYTAPLLDIVAQPPFMHQDTVLHGFILKSDQAELQAAVDTMFAPLGFRYQVESAAVLLTALYVGRATAANGRYAGFGWSSEIDLAFWALASAEHGGFVWIPFYMFVDSGVALIAGREIYGFPKQLARFDRDMTTLNHDPSVAVHTDFFRPSVGGPSAAVSSVLVQIRTAAHGLLEEGLQGKDAPAPETIDEATFLARFAASMGRPPELMNRLTPPYGTPNGVSAPMLFLKQFRDAAAPDRACYRAAVSAETRSIGPIEITTIPGRFVVDLTPSASHPIAADLALTSGMIAEGGFMIRQDFEVSRATVMT